MSRRHKKITRSAGHNGSLAKMFRSLERNSPKLEVQPHVGLEISLILILLLLAFTFLSLQGSAGVVGDAWKRLLLYSIGLWGIYLLMAVFAGVSLTLLFNRNFEMNFTRWVGFFLFFVSVLGMFGLSVDIERVENPIAMVTSLGGYLGFFTDLLLKSAAGEMGTRVILFAVLLIALLLIFQKSFLQLITSLFAKPVSVEKNGAAKSGATSSPKDKFAIAGLQATEPHKAKKMEKKEELIIKKPGDTEEKKSETFQTKEIASKKQPQQEWVFPSTELLESGTAEVVIDEDLLKSNADKIKEKLAQFAIPVVMRDLHVGPTVMQYTLEPPAAVKLSKITSLKNDLALALAAKSIRIEAPIPGKALVGIEIPNEKRIIVHLREILESKDFFEVKSTLRFPLGRDVSGKPIIDALDMMPHVLIAGATGSGKSVAINSLLVSLLYQNAPRDLKMILIDPKRVELSTYNSLPHLLTPVITDPEKAINALRWTVGEMTRRYKECQMVGARNREEFNKKVEEQHRMPYLVFVVDELADLMMTSFKKEVETLICRIAQMARAVGIHLVIATQRPSVDVITGLIKANIPSRVAFSVVSSVDSRTILDSIGAEDLIGKGDMLYISSNMSKPVRIQGVYVSSDEIEKVTTAVRMTLEPEYDEEITTPKKADVATLMSGGSASSMAGEGGGSDEELVEQAIQVIRDTGKVSASLLQRRLKLGYARAARIIDLLEERGVVGPAVGAKPREILIEHSSSGAEEDGEE